MQAAQQAWIGLGANLGADPAATLRAALASLAATEGIALSGQSSLYRSAFIGAGDQASQAPQPDYLNAVARIDTRLDARQLLHALLRIEADFGRQRSGLNAARTLDLDLLIYGNAQINEPDLIVPHPRLHQRAFVLLPMAEIDAHAQIPGRGRVADWLADVAGQSIQRL